MPPIRREPPEAIRANLRQAVARLLEDGGDSTKPGLSGGGAAGGQGRYPRGDRPAEGPCRAARQLLGEGGPVGRKLDFLAQEFNRECNTICSKSTAAAVTAPGLT